MAFLEYEYTDEPHATRRKLILEQHPDMKKLMIAKGDPSRVTALIIICLTHTALGFLYSTDFVGSAPRKVLFFTFIGSWFSAWIFLSMHEAVHGLIFGPTRPRWNKAYGLVANLFLGLPIFAFWRKHHLKHHKYLGDSTNDIELPTELEQRFFDAGMPTRLLWQQLNPIFQIIRALLMKTNEDVAALDIINFSSTILFNILIYLALGETGGHLITYFAGSFFIAIGISTVGLWGLAVHTVYYKGYDTSSYYGILNKAYLNFGYHNEHHDFPNIPGRLLPKVKEIAPEYYNHRPVIENLYSAFVKFLHHSGIRSRIKREVFWKKNL